MTQVSKDFKAKNSLRESNSFIIHNINKIIICPFFAWGCIRPPPSPTTVPPYKGGGVYILSKLWGLT